MVLQQLPHQLSAALGEQVFQLVLSFPEPAETDVVYADGLIDTVYYEEPAQVEIFTTLFRRLNSEALPVEESIARIRAAIQEMD